MKWLVILVATITQHPRQLIKPGVDFKWSSKSWVHNVFRLYEYIFGRRDGIKAEMTVDQLRGIVVCHSWESVFAFAETYVRELLHFRFWKPVHIWVPVLMTPQGIPVFASPYLFAIAWDTAVNANIPSGAATVSITWNHTITGSNTYASVATLQAVEASDDITAFTWNTTGTLTKIGGQRMPSADRFSGLWNIKAPATGTNAFLVTFTGNFMACTSSSYSGTNQTSQPDSSNAGTIAATTTINPTTTVVAANCWLVGMLSNNNVNIVSTTNTSRTGNNVFNMNLIDSNGIVGTGSQALNGTGANATGGWGFVVSSVAPFTASVVNPVFITLLGVGI